MRFIHLCSGIPGSGKSTYTNSLDPMDNAVVHRDEVRDQLRILHNSTEYYPVSEKEEYDAWISACASKIIVHPECNHFWFDQTSLTDSSIAKFFNALAECMDQPGIAFLDNIVNFKFIVERFDIDVDEAIRRNNTREGRAKVPEHVIRMMAKLDPPSPKFRKLIKSKYAYVPMGIYYRTRKEYVKV